MKHQTTLDRQPYDGPEGTVAWWTKDGAWHIALRNISTGVCRWEPDSYPTREAAITALRDNGATK